MEGVGDEREERDLRDVGDGIRDTRYGMGETRFEMRVPGCEIRFRHPVSRISYLASCHAVTTERTQP